MQIKASPTGDGGLSMIDATSSSLSALSAFRKKMDVTANNVANALTDEFKKSRVTMEEGSPNGVKAVVDRVETHGFPKESIRDGESVTVESSNVDLNEELPEMVITQTAYSANLKTVKAQNDMMGSLLDIFS
jgi:flagellar hook protein FlgE